MARAANEGRLTAFQQGHLLTHRGPPGLADGAGGGSSVVLTSQPLGKKAWIERPALQYRIQAPLTRFRLIINIEAPAGIHSASDGARNAGEHNPGWHGILLLQAPPASQLKMKPMHGKMKWRAKPFTYTLNGRMAVPPPSTPMLLGAGGFLLLPLSMENDGKRKNKPKQPQNEEEGG